MTIVNIEEAKRYAEARRYLRGVQAMADEAVRSLDPKVLALALQILERSPDNIRRLLRKMG